LADNQIGDEVSAYIASATNVTSRVGDIHVEAHSLDADYQKRYTSSDTPAGPLQTGDTVKVADDYQHGGDKGSVYQFLGESYNATTSMGTADLKAGDKVLIEGGYLRGGDVGAVYKFVPTSEPGVDLGKENYADTTRWTPVTTDLTTQDYSDTSRWMKL